MTIMLPGKQVSRLSYMLRALIAAALILAFSLWMIARSTGVLSNDPKVYAEIPVSAGVITGGAPVRYHGIKVGEITSIEAGTESSRVGLTIDQSAIGDIPDTVMVRVLPRTFFGDIYLQFVPKPGAPAAQGNSLTPGMTVAVDDGPDAVNLYSLFTDLSDLIAEVKPDQLNVALAAVDRAIGGRGDELGVMIDNWWAASKELETTLDRFIDATPQFRRVAESLQRATPAVIESLHSVTGISRGIAEHAGNLGEFLTAAAGFVSATGEFVAAEQQNLITVLDSTGTILATVADHPSGITRTVREADKFGAAGTILFASGRFNITAVPTFSEPMPYTAADCPTYGSLRGADCRGTGTGVGTGRVRQPGHPNGTVLHPVIDGAAEKPAMAELEGAVRPGSRGTEPNPATTLMLGPMVRGNQVQVR